MSPAKPPAIPHLSRDEIEERANSVLLDHGLYSVPVDLVTLANRQGIKVHNAKFSEEGISGMLAKRGDNITMLIHQSDHPNRKRFTIAHELGHHFLHLMEDGEIVDNEGDLFRNDWGRDDTIEQEDRRREVQANQFAAALLMPARLVEEVYQEVTKDITEISRIFKVSREAMGYRLNQLGLL